VTTRDERAVREREAEAENEGEAEGEAEGVRRRQKEAEEAEMATSILIAMLAIMPPTALSGGSVCYVSTSAR